MGRRQVTVAEQDRWVFNKVGAAYWARPPYPSSLLDALSIGPGRVVDLGAGVGHLALPLARRGHRVIAVEPARRMLEELSRASQREGLSIEARLATAESTGLPERVANTICIADALHFFDAELAGKEVGRLLTHEGRVALVNVEPSESAFMRRLDDMLARHTTRRPKPMSLRVEQFLRVARLVVTARHRFEDIHDVGPAELLKLLASFSYVGPAMSPERSHALTKEIDALYGAVPDARYSRRISLLVAERS